MKKLLLLLVLSSLTACAFTPRSPINPFDGDPQPAAVNAGPPPITKSAA